MHYGFIIPRGTAQEIVAMAEAAEAAGWDGVFYWDGIAIPDTSAFDPWALLGAIAVRTTRVRLGALITPVARRRPWKLARETMTVDRLSNGRLIVPVGLGALDDAGFAGVGEATDRKTRAERLDEGLAILTGLWSGQPFHFDGQHYHVAEMNFQPPPVQQPRIPIWVVGAWPRERSMARALRYDGLLPNVLNADGTQGTVTPPAIRAMAAYVATRRGDATPFDIVVEGETPGDDAAAARAIVAPFAEAGATWWIEAHWGDGVTVAQLQARIQQGPPRVSAPTGEGR